MSQFSKGDRVRIVGRPKSTATIDRDPGGEFVWITWDHLPYPHPDNGRTTYIERDRIEADR